MRRTTLLLVTSMFANAVLATVFYVSRTDPVSDPSGRGLSFGDGTSALIARGGAIGGATTRSNASSLSAYFEHIRGLGLTVDETKPLILSRLEAEFLSGAERAFEEKYWEAGMNEDYLAAEVELAEEQGRVRAALIDLYGPEAQRDAAFRRVFRPLEPRLAVLTSAQQIAYQKYRFERQLTGAANGNAGMGLAGQRPAVAPNAVVADHRSTVEELSRFLDPEAVAEVLYRYSVLAEQIRSAGVELAETEFRDTFRVLEQLELSVRNAATFLETRSSLRDLLGADRFTRLWAARDPVYAAIAAVGTELGLTEATTLAAYQIINDRQELMADVVQLQSVDPERAQARAREATVGQRERLSGLVGPEAAERLLRSLRLVAREVTGQSVEGGRVPSVLPTRPAPPSPAFAR